MAERTLTSHAAGENILLRSLPPSAVRRITHHLTPVVLPAGRIVLDAGDPIRDVYFLRSGLASCIASTADGASVEVAAIGRYGLLGLPAGFAPEPSPFRIVIQVRAVGVRMPIAECRDAVRRRGAFQDEVLRYAAALGAQMSIVSACNRLHSAEQRLARWLLFACTLTGARTLPVTQAPLAAVLGVPRRSVALAARLLNKDGLIEYSPRRLRVLRPADLEVRSCACYLGLRARTVL